MKLLSAIFGGPAHRRATVVIGLALVFIAFTILSIGKNSPYTHANLSAAYDQRYERTEQILVGAPTEFGGLGPSLVSADDPAARGAALYVTSGCVGCHALEGRGGAVAKAIAGVDAQLLVKKVRDGTSGMPPFSPTLLTDEQLALILTYLRSLPSATAP
jgi:mono/diheme cytochrome c family protein